MSSWKFVYDRNYSRIGLQPQGHAPSRLPVKKLRRLLLKTRKVRAFRGRVYPEKYHFLLFLRIHNQQPCYVDGNSSDRHFFSQRSSFHCPRGTFSYCSSCSCSCLSSSSAPLSSSIFCFFFFRCYSSSCSFSFSSAPPPPPSSSS